MSTANLIPLAVVVGIFVLPAFGTLLTMFLKHREKMRKLHKKDLKTADELRDRIEALEKKCARLEEQIAAAHLLMEDEQRQLDTKLNRLLDEPAKSDDESAARKRAAAEKKPWRTE